MNKKLQDQLIEKAAEAAKKSYAPYSKFHVGAALLVAGKHLIITGCNVENASFGLTICAERAALAAAVSAGHRRFEAIAVAASGTQASSASGATPPTRRREALWRSAGRGKPVVPCGACLQALAEFCKPDLIVLAVTTARQRKVNVYKLQNLLPHAFRFRS